MILSPTSLLVTKANMTASMILKMKMKTITNHIQRRRAIQARSIGESRKTLWTEVWRFRKSKSISRIKSINSQSVRSLLRWVTEVVDFTLVARFHLSTVSTSRANFLFTVRSNGVRYRGFLIVRQNRLAGLRVLRSGLHSGVWSRHTINEFSH